MAAPIYGAVIATRNRRFDRGQGVERLDRPVVSVGNITVGGTGKSPMVSWIAQRLVNAGRRPVIAMRGYRAPENGKSDEHLEHERRTPDVPVIANPRRAEALRAFFSSNPEYDDVILDDGFQHRMLARDLDLVLVDATRSPFHDRLLPAGWLREPVESLARADGVIVTRANLQDETRLDTLRDDIERITGEAPVAGFRHVWTTALLHSQDGVERDEAIGWIAGRRVLIVCGIGHPRSFTEMVVQHGAQVANEIILSDHARYDAPVIDRIRRESGRVDAVVTTQKDLVKLAPGVAKAPLPAPIFAPRLEVVPIWGESELVRQLSAVTKE
ncbi:MAG: tetraacyldisaccharide 4'-kinase [Phycisphaerales bacterium]